MVRKRNKANTETIPVNDKTLRGLVGYNMKRSYITIQTDMLKVLGEFGLRLTAFSALVLIVDNPDMTQSQLAAALSIERSGVVLLVDDLENRDLISRNKVPGDRRTYALRATLAGMQFRDRVIAKVQAHEDRLFHKLTDDQKATLVELLNLVEQGNDAVSSSRKR